MSARDLFLYFGDFLSDFFCSPASGYLLAFAGAGFIGFSLFALFG